MTATSQLPSVLLLLVLLLCNEVDALSLTPATPPEQILQSQLISLQQDDMNQVFSYASPRNKMQVGDSIDRFQQMVKNSNGPYVYLIGHDRSEILLESNMAASKQYLVRILPNSGVYPGQVPRDYWWSLSRSPSGEHQGCFLVDAVFPSS